ncbi:hypothetical protein GIB67_013055 [Kingdonia uniflora]|uniref:Uncharacterized protein n=1 Tax=Kingdonia uniflora TaxID=39325 RepID=A0A7J7MCZ4_9MAGN|nr:hypothetical protein GIB67_013055 [Kingdonia uniflora]
MTFSGRQEVYPGETAVMGEPFSIQISSNLLKQLAGDEDKSKRKTKKPKPKVQQSKVHHKQASDGLEPHQGTTSAGWPLQPPFFLPVSPPPPQVTNAEADAIRTVLQESERIMERLQKQEETMVQEVTQKAKELHDKEFKIPYQKPLPCLVEKDSCLDCYKEHVKDPLKCAEFAKMYADCARKVRQQMSS